MASIPSLREMLDNGVHFGHTTSRWNPKMKPYIFTARQNVHIIDLEQTRQKLDQACQFLQSKVKHGATVLFVCTKEQTKVLTEEAAKKCGMPYITERWFGGELTNFTVLQKNIKSLEKIEEDEIAGKFERLTKKERLKIDEKHKKALAVLGGIRKLNRLPDVMFVADAVHDDIAVKEANSLKIPVIAIVDTNANPYLINYPIPANDDAPKSVALVVETIGKAVSEAKIQASKEAMNDKETNGGRDNE